MRRLNVPIPAPTLRGRAARRTRAPSTLGPSRWSTTPTLDPAAGVRGLSNPHTRGRSVYRSRRSQTAGAVAQYSRRGGTGVLASRSSIAIELFFSILTRRAIKRGSFGSRDDVVTSSWPSSPITVSPASRSARTYDSWLLKGAFGVRCAPDLCAAAREANRCVLFAQWWADTDSAGGVAFW